MFGVDAGTIPGGQFLVFQPMWGFIKPGTSKAAQEGMEEVFSFQRLIGFNGGDRRLDGSLFRGWQSGMSARRKGLAAGA
jgi:hypothetical protein